MEDAGGIDEKYYHTKTGKESANEGAAPLGAQERGGGKAVPSGEPAARLPLRTGLEGHLQGRVEDHVEEVIDAVIGHDVEASVREQPVPGTDSSLLPIASDLDLSFD